MQLEYILKEAIRQRASDLFIIAGLGLSFKVSGRIETQQEERLTPEDTAYLIQEIYSISDRDNSLYHKQGDDDFSFSIPSVGRFRVNAYMQRGSEAAVIRIVQFELPDEESLGIPKQVIELYKKTKGLVLVTGPAGNGKSTTLACIINKINTSRKGHIITLEDPIEYIHSHELSIVSQREIPTDTQSYVKGLRAALREAPDVILLGEMRDLETMQIAMTAAETGQLIFSSLHTLGAANTIDRIIDVFPAAQQQQIRIQLAMVLQAVVCEQLVPTIDGGLVPAFEIMLMNPALCNMIREAKVHQIESVLFSHRAEGMITMDTSLFELYEAGKISRETALLYCNHPEILSKKI